MLLWNFVRMLSCPQAFSICNDCIVSGTIWTRDSRNKGDIDMAVTFATLSPLLDVMLEIALETPSYTGRTKNDCLFLLTWRTVCPCCCCCCQPFIVWDDKSLTKLPAGVQILRFRDDACCRRTKSFLWLSITPFAPLPASPRHHVQTDQMVVTWILLLSRKSIRLHQEPRLDPYWRKPYKCKLKSLC